MFASYSVLILLVVLLTTTQVNILIVKYKPILLYIILCSINLYTVNTNYIADYIANRNTNSYSNYFSNQPY